MLNVFPNANLNLKIVFVIWNKIKRNRFFALRIPRWSVGIELNKSGNRQAWVLLKKFVESKKLCHHSWHAYFLNSIYVNVAFICALCIPPQDSTSDFFLHNQSEQVTNQLNPAETGVVLKTWKMPTKSPRMAKILLR